MAEDLKQPVKQPPVTATIARSSPRYASWIEVHGSPTVAILSPLPHRASAPGFPHGALFYKLDVQALAPEARSRMVDALVRDFGGTQAEAERDIDDPEHGVPLLAQDLSITINDSGLAHSLLDMVANREDKG